MMNGSRRMQGLVLLVGALTVLLAAGTGVGHAGDAERAWGSSAPAVTAGSTFGCGAPGTLDPRLQRDLGAGNAQRSSRHDGLSATTVLAQQRRASRGVLAALLERAGHPERVGVILRRGPPGSSA